MLSIHIIPSSLIQFSFVFLLSPLTARSSLSNNSKLRSINLAQRNRINNITRPHFLNHNIIIIYKHNCYRGLLGRLISYSPNRLAVQIYSLRSPNMRFQILSWQDRVMPDQPYHV